MGINDSEYRKKAKGYHILNDNEITQSRVQVNFVVSQHLDYDKTSRQKNAILNDVRKHERKLVLEEIKNGKRKLND